MNALWVAHDRNKYMLNHDKSKDDINWEHVWFRKIVYNYDESERVKDCKRFYK